MCAHATIASEGDCMHCAPDITREGEWVNVSVTEGEAGSPSTDTNDCRLLVIGPTRLLQTVI